MIISNSSPLIHLTRVGKILPLLNIESKIIIPKMVHKETIIVGLEKGYSDAIFLDNLVKEKKIDVRDVNLHDRDLRGYLHEGEYEALQLALELNLPLIIDDMKSRRVANMKNVEYRSTMQVILELFEIGEIDFQHFHQNMYQYSKSGWISQEILNEYLNEGKLLQSRRHGEDDAHE